MSWLRAQLLQPHTHTGLHLLLLVLLLLLRGPRQVTFFLQASVSPGWGTGPHCLFMSLMVTWGSGHKLDPSLLGDPGPPRNPNIPGSVTKSRGRTLDSALSDGDSAQAAAGVMERSHAREWLAPWAWSGAECRHLPQLFYLFHSQRPAGQAQLRAAFPFQPPSAGLDSPLSSWSLGSWLQSQGLACFSCVALGKQLTFFALPLQNGGGSRIDLAP